MTKFLTAVVVLFIVHVAVPAFAAQTLEGPIRQFFLLKRRFQAISQQNTARPLTLLFTWHLFGRS
jgi:hypothetical protein